MAATSYPTWLHFIWAGLRPMLEILGAVPYVGPIAATIQNGLRALLRTLDAGIAALAPLLSASNMLLYGLGGLIVPFVGIKLIDLIVHNVLGA